MRTILSVDDSSSVRMILRAGLRQQYNIVEAASAEDAIEMLDEGEEIDMIVSGYNMDNMNGYELLRHVRQSPIFSDLPFVILSFEEDQNKILEAQKAKVDAWVKKPYILPNFLETLDECFKKRYMTPSSN